jgi:hypothetical protein
MENDVRTTVEISVPDVDLPVKMLGVNEARVKCDTDGTTLFWFGSEPPGGIPTPKAFVKLTKGGNLSTYAPPWAAIAFSRTEKTAWICTDFLGLKHLFVRNFGNGIAVGPEALKLASLGPCLIDPIAVYELFTRGNPQGGRTLFREVNCIPPATIIRVGVSLARSVYWRFPELKPLDAKSAIELYSRAVKTACVRHWRPGLRQELTAGRDSMLILAALLSEGVQPRCWTHGTAEGADLLGAQQRAQYFGVSHQALYLEPLLLLDPSEAASLALWYLNASNGLANVAEYWHLPWVLRRVDAVGSVSGVGGEVFRGFYYQWAGRGTLPTPIGRWTLIHGKLKEMMPFPHSVLASAIVKLGERKIRSEVQCALSSKTDYWHRLDEYYLTNRMHHFAGTTFSATGRIQPVVLPLFDIDVVSCIASVPIEIREWETGLSAAVTRECLERLGKEPLQIHSSETKSYRLRRLAGRLRELHGTTFHGVSRDLARLLFQAPEFRVLCNYESLHTGELYNPRAYTTLMRRASDACSQPMLMGAIATVEWAARSIGSSYCGICYEDVEYEGGDVYLRKG